jgi:predicted MFS family arabinose efflux permease
LAIVPGRPLEGGAHLAPAFLPLMTAAGFAITMTAPIELLYARRLGAGTAGLAAYIALPALCVLVVDFFGTRFIPRLDARAVMAGGVLLFGVGATGMGVAPSYPALLPAAALQGFGAGLLFGSALQGAVRVNPVRDRALGRFNGSFVLGSVLGTPAGGLIAAVVRGTAGYRLAFMVCGACSLLVSLALRFALPRLPPVGEERTARIGLPRLSGAPGVAPALILGTFGDLLRGGVVYTALPLAGQARHLSTATIGLAVGLLSAVEITTLHGASRFFLRFGIMRCLLAALGLGIAAASFLALTRGEVAFLVGALVFGVVIATATLAPPLLLVSLHDDTAAGLASFRIASGFGMLVGSTGASTVTTTIGSSGVFVAIAGVLAGGTMVAAGISRRRSRATPPL